MLYGIAFIILTGQILSQPRFRSNRPYQFKPRSSVFLGFLIGMNFGDLFEISLFSFCTLLSISVLFLSVLIITKKIDHGLFGFLTGTVFWIGINFFEPLFIFCVVVAICIFALGFKFWLDLNWLGAEEDHDQPAITSVQNPDQKVHTLPTLIFLLHWALPFLIFVLQWDRDLFRTKCQISTQPIRSISCSSGFLWKLIACTIVLVLWFILSVSYVNHLTRDRDELGERQPLLPTCGLLVTDEEVSSSATEITSQV